MSFTILRPTIRFLSITAIIVISVSNFALAASQKRIGLAPCTGPGVDAETLISICELAKEELLNLGYASQPIKRAGDSGFAESAELKVLKLGSSYVLTFSRYERTQALSSVKLKASSVEEIDAILPRLVRASLNQTSIQSDIRVGEVTEAEAKANTLRKNAQKSFGLAVGFGGTNNLDGRHLFYDFGVGWSINWTSFRLKFLWDFAFQSQAWSYFTSLVVGGNWYLTTREASPYVSGRMGFGLGRPTGPITIIDTENSVSSYEAPLIGAGFGWEFFRNHKKSIAVEFRTDILARKVEDLGVPMLFALQISTGL